MDDGPTPLEVADAVRARVYVHPYPGQRKPSVTFDQALITPSFIQQEFAVDEPTARATGDILHQWGIGKAGVPHLMRHPQDRFRAVAASDKSERRGAFAAEALEAKLSHEQRVEHFGSATAPPAVVDALGVDRHERVHVRRRVMLLDDHPVQLADSYLPMPVVEQVKELGEQDTGPGGTYARLQERFGPLSYEERLFVRMPLPEELDRLHRRNSEPFPVWDLTRIAHATTGPVECFKAVMVGPAYGIEYRVPA